MPVAGDPEGSVILVTMEDIKAMTDDFITPATAAAVMKMDTGRLIGYARSGQLPFPVQISGNRVKIPRIGFLRAFGIEAEERKRKDGIEAQLKELTRQISIMNILLTAAVSKYAPASLAIFGDQIKELEKHEPVQDI